MISVYFDTSPLKSGHAARGIGSYTRFLFDALSELKTIEVTNSVKEKKNTQVIHYPYFDLFFSTLPIQGKRKQVVTIHDVIPLEFPEFYKPGIRGKVAFYRQKLALKAVSAVITDSNYSKQRIHELLGVPHKKIHVVYLAANPDLKTQEKSAVRAFNKQHGLVKEYILYVGDINYNKNLPQLIKAVKYMPDTIDLVCVGRNFKKQDIPEWQWIETQLVMSDVSDRVHFIDDLESSNSDALSAAYSGALAYIQPSLSEGFGLPVLEALRCGTPVIASRFGSLPEVGGEAVLYVEPTAVAIAQAVESIYMWTDYKRSQVIEDGIAWSKTFTWKKAAATTASIYESITAKK